MNVVIPGPLGQDIPRWRRYWGVFVEPLLAWVGRILPRLLDILIAVALLVLLSPLMLVAALMAKWLTGQVFEIQTRVGRYRAFFEQLRFNGDVPFADWAMLINILKGDMALVGPRALSRREAEALNPSSYARFLLRPGLISPYALKSKVGIGYDGEESSDLDFFYTETAKGNLGYGLRYLVGGLLAGGAPRPSPPTLSFFDVTITNTSMAEAIDWMVMRVKRRQKARVAFVNPDCLNIAYRHAAYKKSLMEADQVLPDGIGIHLGCRILGVSLNENVNGTDLFPRLCERAVKENMSLFLLGAKPGVAQAAAEAMQKRYPGLRIAGTRDGYFDQTETAGVINAINKSGAEFLLVAMGAPRQDLWLEEHGRQLNPAIRMGVGGLFDFYSGRIPRAPLWMREIGLEWVYRLLQEPGRMWRRYVIGNPLFLFRVWRQKRQGSGSGQVALQGGEAPVDSRDEIINRFENIQAQAWRHRLRVRFKRLAWRSVVGGAYVVKRLLDIVGSAILLLLLSPVFLGIALAIKFDSPGPLLFKQVRVGRFGQYFTMWKFRSMYMDAEARKQAIMAQNEMAGGVIFKMKNDPRITRIGRFIRRASIDELPQLWNVLMGDMSLVGPRPALPSEVNQYSLAERRRLEVIPGITCIWQVSGRSDIPFDKQVGLDVDYIESQSLWLDIKLLLLTVPAVLLGRGAY